MTRTRIRLCGRFELEIDGHRRALPGGRAGALLCFLLTRRERAADHRFLMAALAGRGNIAEALRVYERLRVLLRDELGAAPAAELRALHQRLLGGDGADPHRTLQPRRLPLPRVLSPRERSALRWCAT